MALLYRYRNNLNDIPGYTYVLEHEIRLTTDKPVKYRVSPRLIPFPLTESMKKVSDGISGY